MERTGVYYDLLEFEFKPEKGRELLALKDEFKNMVLNNIYDVYRNELKLWDEELINVVDPLEKNLSLLKVLYQVTFMVSILIAGILAFMMVLRRTLDVAILRVLGVKEKGKVVLNSLGIDGAKQSRYPSNLSDGEQQRVAIGRTLATGTKVILADEATLKTTLQKYGFH